MIEKVLMFLAIRLIRCLGMAIAWLGYVFLEAYFVAGL